MKALYQINGELGHVEGPAEGVLTTLVEFSQDASFVAEKLFITTPEMKALADADEQSDLLDQFIICLDDKAKPSLNADAGIVTKTTYRPVTEDNMSYEMNRGFGMETDESATGRFGDDALDTLDLFEDEDGDVSYAGAAGTHNSDGLDLMPLPWGAPASGPTKDPSSQRNSKTATAQRSGTEEPLDVLDMKW